MNLRFNIDTRQLIQAVGGLCVLLYLCTWLLSIGAASFSFSVALHSLWKIQDGEILRKLGALYGPDVWIRGQWWRVLSLGFLHGSFLHLMFNVVALFSLGPWLRELARPAFFLTWLIVSIVWSGLASLFWADGGLVVGISGGIFGLAGGLVAGQQLASIEVRERLSDLPLRQLFFGLSLILFLGGILEYIPGFPKLANAGHWGGLIGGTLVVLAFFGSSPQLRMLAWLSLILASVGLGYAAQRPYSEDRYFEILAYHHFERKEFDQAEHNFRALLEIRRDDALIQNALSYLLLESGGNLVEAQTLIEQAIVKLPNHPDLLDTYGWLHCKQGQVVAGMKLLNRAISASETENSEIVYHLENCASAFSQSAASDTARSEKTN